MLIIITTHPIQYQVPLWKEMTEAGINLEVWYLTKHGANESFDQEFGQSFKWDIPLLEGYKYKFLEVNDTASPNGSFFNIKIKSDIKKLLIESKATHVYLNGWNPFAYWQILWIAKALKLKTILKGESNNLRPENSLKKSIKKLLMRMFFARIDYFLYIGEANKKLYKDYNIPEYKLLPGLYCVDNKRFRIQKDSLCSQKITLREKWNIPPKAFCILFSGKFIEKKRPLDLVYATKQLISSYNIHLLFVGDGAFYEKIRQETNVMYDDKGHVDETINKFQPNVSFTGFLNQKEIAKAYTVADCLVLPSDYGETWGLVVNEAMASGIPAIVSDQCGAAQDLAKPIDENLVFQTGDINELTKSLEWLINNPINEQHIFQVQNNYSYNSTITSLKKIIRDFSKN